MDYHEGSSSVGGRPGRSGGVVRRGALRLRGAGFVLVVVRLLGAVVQHQRLGLVGDGDGAGALRPRLAVHLHGHRGALQNQPDSVRLSQPHRVGQLDLDLCAVEGAEHAHNLQQTIIQPAGSDDTAADSPLPRKTPYMTVCGEERKLEEEEKCFPFTPSESIGGSERKITKMKKLLVFLLCLVVLTLQTDANPVIKESFAKQLLRSKRQERPMKAGHPDEPMREHLLHMQALDQRAQETNLEYWLNPHCPPRCDRNYGHPV